MDDAGIERDGGEAVWEFLGERGGKAFDGIFGGAIVALVELQDADRVLFEVKKAYESQTHHEATGYLCRAGDGALPPDGSGR